MSEQNNTSSTSKQSDTTVATEVSELERDIHNTAIDAALSVLADRISSFTSRAKAGGPNADYFTRCASDHIDTSAVIKTLLIP